MTDNSNNNFRGEEDELKSLQFDKLDQPLDGDLNINSKKRYIRLIILLSILILIIILIVVIIVVSKKDDDDNDDEIICKSGYFLPDDSNNKNCEKCSLDNCEKCFGKITSNICKECEKDFFPNKEKDVIKSCDLNCILDNNCLECDNQTNNCLKCNSDTDLINGKCIRSYSFTAIYRSNKKNERIQLINDSYLPFINSMYLNNSNISINSYYTFSLPGEHKIGFLMDISSLDSINNMFREIIKMISISFRNTKLSSNDILFFDTSKITDFSFMFFGCTSLTSIDITNFQTMNVINMSFMFYNCSKISSIDISDFNTSNVLNMEYLIH